MKDERVYLLHMLECAERIFEFTRGGQAIRDQAPDVPWKQICGFRDVLIHQYEGVDLEQVWQRVERDLPPLHQALTALLQDLPEQP